MDTNFEVLVKKISPTLKRITYRLNGHFSFFNDEDLFQEALIHLWEDFQKGRLSDKTDSYILQGCYFHLKNYLRLVKAKTKVTSIETIIDGEDTTLEETLLLQDEAAKCYLDNLDNRLLVETIQNNGLTAREKDILSLCMDGLTTREVGARLCISHVRVVKLIARIRTKCTKYL